MQSPCLYRFALFSRIINIISYEKCFCDWQNSLIRFKINIISDFSKEKQLPILFLEDNKGKNVTLWQTEIITSAEIFKELLL